VAIERGVDSALLAEIQKPVFHPVLLIDMDWPSGRNRGHTGRGVINFDGFEWGGVTRLASLVLPGDQSGFAAKEATMTIAGEFADLFALCTEASKGRFVTFYWGCTTVSAGTELVGTTFRRFSGKIAGSKLVDEGRS